MANATSAAAPGHLRDLFANEGIPTTPLADADLDWLLACLMVRAGVDWAMDQTPTGPLIRNPTEDYQLIYRAVLELAGLRGVV